MQEVAGRLYVGCAQDWETISSNNQPKLGWAVIQAAKEPWHRLELGYKTRAAPTNHPEYYFALRPNKLILNLIDADNPAYIPKELVDQALKFAHEQLELGKKVLIHCNRGCSRAPTLALLKLAPELPADFIQAHKHFLSRYPTYLPAHGLYKFAMQNWAYYRTKRYQFPASSSQPQA